MGKAANERAERPKTLAETHQEQAEAYATALVGAGELDPATKKPYTQESAKLKGWQLVLHGKNDKGSVDQKMSEAGWSDWQASRSPAEQDKVIDKYPLINFGRQTLAQRAAAAKAEADAKAAEEKAAGKDKPATAIPAQPAAPAAPITAASVPDEVIKKAIPLMPNIGTPIPQRLNVETLIGPRPTQNRSNASKVAAWDRAAEAIRVRAIELSRGGK
jgi:hypothetical protein